MSRPTILLADDDVELRAMLTRYLDAEGFDVVSASNGEVALERFEVAKPDVVILDVGMPKLDGFEVLTRIRAASDVYVIMLTARSEELDRVMGLTMGADDYLTKPFSPRELAARIRAVLRRRRSGPEQAPPTRAFEGLEIDPGGRTVDLDGQAVTELSALEFDLLEVLAANPGRVFTRSHLLERVWGFDYFGTDRVVDVHIANIRKALGDDAAEPRFIATVRGVGYKFMGVPR
jgi:DNA-binding response OmpR family regulator